MVKYIEDKERLCEDMNIPVPVFKEIPDYMIDGIVLYICRGVKPGHFLSSVIKNDLQGAFTYADGTNKSIIGKYVGFFYLYAPHFCHGSEEKMDKWIEKGGLYGGR